MLVLSLPPSLSFPFLLSFIGRVSLIRYLDLRRDNNQIRMPGNAAKADTGAIRTERNKKRLGGALKQTLSN